MTDTMSQFSQNVDRTILEEVGGLSLEAEEPMNQFSFNLLKRGGYSPWENVYRMYTLIYLIRYVISRDKLASRGHVNSINHLN